MKVLDYINSKKHFQYVGDQSWGNVSNFYCSQEDATTMANELGQADEPIIDHPDVTNDREAGYFIQSGNLWYQFSDGSREAVLVTANAPGTPPDTSLHLGDERKEWLRQQGGIQPTIIRLIDEAMQSN